MEKIFYTNIDEVTNSDLLEFILDLDFGDQLSVHREVLLNLGDDLNVIEDMDFINDFFCDCEPAYILERAFYGFAEPCNSSPFNPNDAYFSFTGYGNLRSLSEYIAEQEVKEYFEYWLKDGEWSERDKVQEALLYWWDEKDILDKINEIEED